MAAILLFLAVAAVVCRRSDPSPAASGANPAGAAGGPGKGAATAAGAVGAAGQDDHVADLAALRRFEDERRSRTDFEQQPKENAALGADPYRVKRLGARRGGLAVGLLRGADAVVLLDQRGRELARAAAPPSPTALAMDGSGRIWVGGTGSAEIALYRASLRPAARLARIGGLELHDAWTVRALAASSDGAWLYAADQRTGLIAALRRGRGDGERRAVGGCHAPVELVRAGDWLVVNCLTEHALLAYALEPSGAPAGAAPLRMEFDGPLWSLAAAADRGRAVVAAGGVEDHPLERRDGGFGYIDSFLYMVELPPAAAQATGAGQLRRLATVNLSEAGVVTPKWISLELGDGDAASVRTAGYASPALLTFTWPALRQGAPPPAVQTRRFVPGTTDWSPSGRPDLPALAASPLFDGWVATDQGTGAPEVVPVAPPPGAPTRSTESRIGEALFFTTLMAPWNRSDGKLSRFTCETCHFEAYGDGRVHYTGRGKVHSVTKPLRGLFNNRPHFTRAFDRTMAEMVHAEFRVANRFSGHDPWFSLEAVDFPWLSAIEGVPATLTPVYLRRSFMTFLMDLGFEPNQAVRGRDHFSARERSGAEVFRDRCESCHRARLITEEPTSAVPFERWEELIFSPPGPIVWASAEYRKTGVEPYVHPEGARTTSLRRLYQKFPYFTNGSAHSLAEVVARAAWVGDRFFHAGADPGDELSRLDPDQQAALAAFLELL